jgi:peroxiredoxin
MSEITPLMPRQAVPDLSVKTVGGGTWTLSEQKPENFTMIVFYRGLHCPICSRYLADLNNKIGEFEKRGVSVLVVSGDGEERATKAKQDWKLDKLTVGYGVSLDEARRWGLYISAGIGKTSIGVDEPALFPEPGLFLIRPDGTLFAASVQTMPFARPSFSEVLGAIEFIVNRGYPARGEILDHKAAA